MLAVQVILCVSSVFEELNSNLSELSVAEYVFLLLNPFCTFLTEFIKLWSNIISRTAVNRLFIADNLLSEFWVNRNRSLSVFACKESEHLVDYTGDSFRDLTRIAKINDEMWSELFLLNKAELIAQMDLFIDKFMLLRNSIESESKEQIQNIMRLSTKRRKYFDK